MRGVSRWSKHVTLVEESSPHTAASRVDGAVIGSVLFLAGMLGLTLPAPGRKKEE
jgi:hypothetical protein